MNKLLKEVIANMGSNLTEVALRRAAQSVSAIQAICQKHRKTMEWIETKKKQFIKYKGAVREENDSDPEAAGSET